MQAIQYLTLYLSLTPAAEPAQLKALVLIALELSIKNNEDKMISFDECSKVIVNDKEYILHHDQMKDEMLCV